MLKLLGVEDSEVWGHDLSNDPKVVKLPKVNKLVDASEFAKVTDLARVALTGSFNDLTDKPSFPDFGNWSVTNDSSGNLVFQRRS